MEIQVVNFARKFSPYCHQAGFLAYGSSLNRLLTFICNGIVASLPIYSDRIAQDLHLIPFSPALCGQCGCTWLFYGIIHIYVTIVKGFSQPPFDVLLLFNLTGFIATKTCTQTAKTAVWRVAASGLPCECKATPRGTMEGWTVTMYSLLFCFHVFFLS